MKVRNKNRSRQKRIPTHKYSCCKCKSSKNLHCQCQRQQSTAAYIESQISSRSFAAQLHPPGRRVFVAFHLPWLPWLRVPVTYVSSTHQHNQAASILTAHRIMIIWSISMNPLFLLIISFSANQRAIKGLLTLIKWQKHVQNLNGRKFHGTVPTKTAA